MDYGGRQLMLTAWGVVVVLLSLLAWCGQAFSWFAPTAAAGLGLADSETDVDPVFWADGRGEALWDTVVLWPMVLAGALMLVDNDAWPYVGLVGGGMYLYFAGRGIVTRLAIQAGGHRIGSRQSVTVGLAALAAWGAMAAVTIVVALFSLAET